MPNSYTVVSGKQFSNIERELIRDTLWFERTYKCTLPIDSFYKSICFSAAKRVLGDVTWDEVRYLFLN